MIRLAAHHPEMVAHITGNVEPICGRDAHAATMNAMFTAFRDVHIDNDPYPLQFGQGANREIGHVHLDRGALDLPLTDDRRQQVLDAARANAWYSNWVSKPLATDADAHDGISLLRESY